MEIIQVTTPQELMAFINLPYDLYRSDPVWVAPLRSEQDAQFIPQKNPMLNHCTYTLFLAKKDGKIVGRISAFVDHLAVEHWKQTIGLFGSFESSNDPEVANGLLNAAREWLKQKGMTSMRGPWSFASQEWGLVVEGFEPSPVIMAPYNPRYYNGLLSNFGLQKAEDLMVYVIDANEGYTFPERYQTLTEIVKKRYGVTVREIDMHNIERDVVIMLDMANISLTNNWGFYPVTKDEAKALARDLKQIVNPKGVLIAENQDGKPIGFAMTLPDINKIIKGLDGRLLPFGWFKLLTGLPKLHQFRMWALGVIPEYQGKAIDTLLYRATYDNLFSDKIRLEINYVLENNDRMNNALNKLGVKNLRRYRVYEMTI